MPPAPTTTPWQHHRSPSPQRSRSRSGARRPRSPVTRPDLVAAHRVLWQLRLACQAGEPRQNLSLGLEWQAVMNMVHAISEQWLPRSGDPPQRAAGEPSPAGGRAHPHFHSWNATTYPAGHQWTWRGERYFTWHGGAWWTILPCRHCHTYRWLREQEFLAEQ